MGKITAGLLCVAIMGSSGCVFDKDNKSANKTDTQLRELISDAGLTGNPAAGRDIASILDPKAQLGMQLFFSKALGGDQDSACVSCHHPALGGGDGLSLPLGVGADNTDLLGPGRERSGSVLPNVPRNAPTTFNIALWDQVLFHDGRVESLSKIPGKNGSAGAIRTPDSAPGTADSNAGANLTVAQSRFPVTSAAEMRGASFEFGNSNQTVRDHLAARLADTGAGSGELSTPDADGIAGDDWQAAFEEVYKGEADVANLISYARIADAIGAYENSQVFVDNPWKAYVEGDNSALSAAQKRGAMLFFRAADDGGAGCANCHRGDFFTDEKFHNIAMIQIGEGKGDGANNDDDFGRFRESKELKDKYAFRTPTLLNIEVTGPYGHAGAYNNLQDVIRHHLNPQNAIDDFFASALTWCHNIAQLSEVADCDALYTHAEDNTRSALTLLTDLQDKGLSKLQNISLDNAQVEDLVAFMQALTDPCVKSTSCIGQWIPDTSTTGAAGLQINAEDANMQPLLHN
ncbi:MAG: cytochrome-c peroxidase [Oceanospirillaceae bacterium]|nr:cytochrome-c peroxidase [Oceanospirillaceae bacterium]MCP5349752.1 cytochrome-c peroxidase [Oceanospirillaceae bacterium]